LKITIRSYDLPFINSDPDPSSVTMHQKMAVGSKEIQSLCKIRLALRNGKKVPTKKLVWGIEDI
jgi:hypothetical protein